MAGRKKSALILGVGAIKGLGAALCQRFAAEGYHIVAGGRTEQRLAAVIAGIERTGGSGETVRVDVTNEGEVARLFEQMYVPDSSLKPDVVIYNVGANKQMEFLSLDAEQFEAFWRVGCFGGFLVGREAARHMLPRGAGTILFTGASASLRGKPGFAHFAAAKAGLRMVAQSMAREYGPRGIHVAHVVIDGGIDGDVIRMNWPGVVAERGEDGLMDIHAIADTFLMLHKQPPSAWTQEIDLRPFKEHF